MRMGIVAGLLLAASPWVTHSNPFSKPLLVMNQHSGRTLPHHAYAERCEIYANKVTISKTFGLEKSASYQETRDISTSTSQIHRLVQEAREGSVRRTEGPFDVASHHIYANFQKGEHDYEQVYLEAKGPLIIDNLSSASFKLKKLVKSICGI